MTKTTTPQVTIHNAETGEIVTRDATAEEIEQMESNIATQAAYDTAKAQQAINKTALLDRLGITAEEAALLLS